MNTSPYHLGFHTHAGQRSLEDLPVQGTVPTWLDGVLLRTAPAIFEIGSEAYQHWFDGLAALHRFAFERGRISYSSRILQSRSYLEATARGRVARGEFSTTP